MTEKVITPRDAYDKTDFFERDCRKLLDELVLMCSIHRIPFFWTAAVVNSVDGTEYISDAAAPASRQIVLADDKISKHLGVATGFDIVPSREKLEVLMEDIPTEEF